GRMMAFDAHRLDIAPIVVAPQEAAPGFAAAKPIPLDFDDAALGARLEAEADVLTYEVEHLPVEAVRALGERVPLRPGIRSLEITGDRLLEKQFIASCGLPLAPFAPVDGPEDVDAALAVTGLPAILKTRRHGYDGKGQRRVSTREEAEAAARELAVPSVLEGFVTFERELSVVAVRGLDGEVRSWPLAENTHRDGILHVSVAPAPGTDGALHARAEAKAKRLMEELDHVGVLTVELFDTGEQLLLNEIAPRVHNSGHWTLEGAVTSQFENHVRAVCGLPLGDTAARGASVMINLLGELPPREALLAVPGLHLHLYGKAPRPGRKLGHATLCADDMGGLREAAARLPEALRAPTLAALA
ncbi:MAG TPA: 5-(carboxyamino)imidazole ribonucleotide synthase, partial [Polyangiaceae bacterium LLY-WYZ-15_(1-7)]|nr:5-(carboxyamino)imidazole ribonucleotide synthase [Polyangiaceae bacterium LLY-WYZ-15_(1-7)]